MPYVIYSTPDELHAALSSQVVVNMFPPEHRHGLALMSNELEAIQGLHPEAVAALLRGDDSRARRLEIVFVKTNRNACLEISEVIAEIYNRENNRSLMKRMGKATRTPRRKISGCYHAMHEKIFRRGANGIMAAANHVAQACGYDAADDEGGGAVNF